MGFESAGVLVAEADHVRPRYTAGVVARCAAGGVAGAFILSWIYGFLDYICPIIYLNFVLTFGMGWLVGVICARLLRRARINGVSAARVVGLVSGAAAAYFSWVAYIWVIADYDFAFAGDFLSPVAMWELMDYLSHNPVWSLGQSSATLPAFMYKMVWLVEAAALVVLPAMGATSFVEKNRLCDGCGDWIGKTEDLALFPLPDDPAGTLAALEGGSALPLTALHRVAPDTEMETWIEAVGHACPRCEDAQAFATVSLVTMELNNKSKKLERKERVLSRHIPLDADLEARIFDSPILETGAADPENDAPEETAAGDETTAMTSDRNEPNPG